MIGYWTSFTVFSIFFLDIVVTHVRITQVILGISWDLEPARIFLLSGQLLTAPKDARTPPKKIINKITCHLKRGHFKGKQSSNQLFSGEIR